MKQSIKLFLIPSLTALLAGCAMTQPPARISEAVSTMNTHMPEYVREANAALSESGHPDAERLAGIGVRLEAGMEALDRWANEEGVKNNGIRDGSD